MRDIDLVGLKEFVIMNKVYLIHLATTGSFLTLEMANALDSYLSPFVKVIVIITGMIATWKFFSVDLPEHLRKKKLRR